MKYLEMVVTKAIESRCSMNAEVNPTISSLGTDVGM